MLYVQELEVGCVFSVIEYICSFKVSFSCNSLKTYLWLQFLPESLPSLNLQYSFHIYCFSFFLWLAWQYGIEMWPHSGPAAPRIFALVSSSSEKFLSSILAET